MELVISRKKWLRGEGSEASQLLRSKDGKMCCLGFYGLACGLEPEDIKDVASPDGASEKTNGNPNLPLKWEDKAPWLFSDDELSDEVSDTCTQLMMTNDDEGIDAEGREGIITRTFAEVGVTVTFVD